MALVVRVEGGTRAGRKRTLRPASSWECRCYVSRTSMRNHDPGGLLDGALLTVSVFRVNPSWRTRCDDCGAQKPK